MTADASPRVLLLDGHSLAYRAFYALPVENFATSTGQATNAVYGFTSMLINLLRDVHPSHIAVAFDVSRTTFRTERFPEYKATRSASPAEFAGQVELIKQVLAAMNITELSVPNFEADDIIATLATQGESQGLLVDIVTGDRDAFQLINDNITVLYPKRGVSELAQMTPAAVLEKYGLEPRFYADFAAIRGDKSDNLPNIPGVGEKTAVKWINEYGGLDGVIKNVDQIKGKVGQSLASHLDQVITNRALTELVRNVALEVEVEDLAWAGVDRERVHEIFDALEFDVLRRRLFDILGEAEESSADRDAVAVTLSDQNPSDWLAAHAHGPVALLVLGHWAKGAGHLEALVLAAAGQAVLFIEAADINTQVRDWLADPNRPKVMHDAKPSMLVLRSQGLECAGLVMDTALAAYLLLPGQRSFQLRDLAMRIAKLELPELESGNQPTLDVFDVDSRQVPLAQEAMALLALSEALGQQLRAKNTLALLEEVELPILLILVEMEAAGIAVDVEVFDRLAEGFAVSIRQAEEQAWAIAGEKFNLGSPKQLQEILFDKRNLPKTKKIKTGYTTDAESLQSLFLQTHDPLLEEILKFRDAAKLKQTVVGLTSAIAQDNRIHTTFNQMVAATGRLSSQDPNLQNIPIRTEAGRAIRGGFVVGEGYETLLTADYSQIEMRIMAHLSEDAGLIAAFRDGEDLHTSVGAKVFGVAPGDVTAEMRRQVKAMSYGLAYGLSSFGLSQQLGISRGEAQVLMDEYFLRFGGVRDYLAQVVEQARATGWTETIMGRRRYLPDLNSDNRQRRGIAERMALNAPIQGSAADLVKVAMIKVSAALQDAQLRSRMLLQVHDELVLEVAPGELETVTELVRTHMGQAYELAVPLDVSVGVGISWAAAGH